MLNAQVLRTAQEILNSARREAMAYKGDEIGNVAWFRTWVETVNGFEVFVEAEVLDFDVIYTVGPFIHPEIGLVNSDQRFTTDLRYAAELLASTVA